ncbi:MAG: DegT/DnrJ/EryC1/StrS family aminotransferase [Anaerolineae bacterium]|nr:DegT/DnrJ/EryC1/StrS family aminotransferase [Anaerolineae bacterium]
MNTNGQAKQVPFVDLAAQYTAIETEINQAISKTLHGTDFILGEEVNLFEQEFAAYCETNYAVGVNSGTSALELALRAYGIGPGDEVITAANTFIATALVISYTGAIPVLVDVDPQTYTMDISRLENAITPRTKAIMPVHLYGHPANMDPIVEIAKHYELVVIEDACQAHGAKYMGKRVGSLGHAAAFSFYPAKNLGAYGDGGMIVTNDAGVAESTRLMRNYGSLKKYHHLIQGYNRRLDTLQAAVLRIKLKYLETWNQARRQHAQVYHNLLVDTSVVTPVEAGGTEPVHHLYVIRVKNRDRLRAYLTKNGIATGIHYPIPIHLQPAYQELGYKQGDFSVAETYAQQILSLPMYPELTSDLIQHVTEIIKKFETIHNINPSLISRSSI